MHQAHVVQRHLAGLKIDHDLSGCIHIDHHFLSSGQKIVRIEGVAMRYLVRRVCAG